MLLRMKHQIDRKVIHYILTNFFKFPNIYQSLPRVARLIVLAEDIRENANSV